MCGVIVVDAESFRSIHGRDAYVHDHCLRCLHNYALFYQLLGSNLFTHVIHAILREVTSETNGPRVCFTSYKFPIYNSSLLFIFQSLLFNLYNKNTKNIYLTIFYQISLLQVAMKGLTTPLSRWLQGS